jgi:hypothetical protein
MKKHISIALIAAAFAAAAASIEFEGTLRLDPQWTNTKTDGASVVRETFSKIIFAAHTTGTNANEMTSLARSSGTLTNSASVTLSLLGGVSNAFGDPITFTRVNFFCITADAANVDSLQIGGAAATPFEAWCGPNGRAVLRPGGTILYHAPDIIGYAVGTNGSLRISNTGTNSAAYSVYIGGI